MKKLILYKSKWVCGQPDIDDREATSSKENSMGVGYSQLLNVEGYMCCLGQWCMQIVPTLTKEDIFDKGEPCEIEALGVEVGEYFDAGFIVRAIKINDSSTTTVEQKITDLTALCLESGYELEVQD